MAESAIIASREKSLSGVEVAEWLRERIRRNRLMFESFYNEARLQAANADHQRNTEAILSGADADAEAAMRRHVEDGFATMAEIDSEFHA